LECFIGVLEAYFGEVTENTIRDNFEIVYMVSYPARISLILCWILLQYLTAALQLIEEMLDEGHPMTTEPNMLKDIVLPPTLVRKLLTAAGVSGYVRSPFIWSKTTNADLVVVPQYQQSSDPNYDSFCYSNSLAPPKRALFE
jgi:hypothetical protein